MFRDAFLIREKLDSFDLKDSKVRNRLASVSYTHLDVYKRQVVYDMKEENENILLGLDYILFAQTLAVLKSLSLDITPDNPCPTGEVNRVVKGVTLYPLSLIHI